MRELINRTFRLRAGEMGVVLTLGFLLLANSVALQISGIVGISGFLSEGGVNNVLIVMLVDYTLILISSSVQMLLVDRYDRLTIMRWMVFIFAMVFVLLRLLFVFRAPGWLSYALLYIVSEQQWLFFPLFFWIFANDLLDMAQTKRLFPVIAGWGFVGKLIGTSIAGLTPTLFQDLGVGSAELLTLNILIYLIAYLLMVEGFRHANVRQPIRKQESLRATLADGWAFVKEVPSFRYLMMATVALTLCDTIIEFRFLVVTDAVFTTATTYQEFFSAYRLAMTLLSFGLTAFVTSRLITRFDLKNMFLYLPVVTLLGALVMMGFPGIVTGVAAMGLLKLVRDTVDDSSRRSVEALVPEETRGRVGLVIGSYLPAVGTILGCIVAGLIVFVGLRTGLADYFYVYLAVTAVAAAFAIWCILKMRTVYDSSLLNWRLKRRRRGSDVLDKLNF